MNKNIRYRLEKLNRILFTDIYLFFAIDKKISPFNQNTNSFVLSDYQLMDALYQNAQKCTPYIHSEIECIYFASFQIAENEFIFIGPISTEHLSFAQKHQFQKMHKIDCDGNLFIPTMDMNIFFDVIELVYNIVTSSYLDVSSQNVDLQNNSWMESEMTTIMKKQDDDEAYHHSYMDERKLIDAIKNGDMEKALYYIEFLLPLIGKLSSSFSNHLRNVAITFTTLATRAAIEGGVSISEAYRTSDVFINLFDKCTDTLELNRLIRQANIEFVKLVQAAIRNRKYSTYVEQCKYYIENNYKHDITLKDLANYLGVSSGYLSHLFVQQESITLSQYLTKIRITHAQNLLKYSESSILEICNYVGFSSQSYFTHVFKQQTGVTPRQFKNKYKTVEFYN